MDNAKTMQISTYLKKYLSGHRCTMVSSAHNDDVDLELYKDFMSDDYIVLVTNIFEECHEVHIYNNPEDASEKYSEIKSKL